jgi:hypothetical protein
MSMKTYQLIFLLAGLALALCLATWSPFVTWAHFGEDGPELEAAGRTLGVPHPTGYPLFTLLVRVVSLAVPPPVSAVNVVSLLAAIAAVVATGMAGRALAAKVLPDSTPAWCGGLAAGAILAASFTWWRQASIGEVYTLHLAIVAGVLALVLNGGRRAGLLAAYLLGLGLTHHLQILPFLLLVLTYVSLGRRGRLRPRHGIHLLLLLLPLTLYAVLVIRSRLDPPFDWGNPETLQNLWWVLSGAPYQKNLLAEGVGTVLGRWGYALVHGPIIQVGLGGLLLAAAGLGLTGWRAKREAVALGLLFVGTTLVASAYSIPDPGAYYLPATLAVCLWAGVGAAGLLQLCSRVPREGIGRVAAAAAGWAMVGGILASRVVAVAPHADARSNHDGFDYASAGIAVLEKDAVVISHGDGRTFALWYGVTVLAERPDVAILYDNLLAWTWYRDQVARTHPWVDPAAPRIHRLARRARLIEYHLRDHPVYVTELELDLAPFYEVQPAGPLFRLRRRASSLATAGASSETRDTGTRSRSRFE